MIVELYARILYGAACTNVFWSSFGQVLLSKYKNSILLESACEAFQETESTPFNPRVIAVLLSVNYLAVDKVRLHTATNGVGVNNVPP